MDTARDGAGRLVEHANRQSCCLKLDSGRSLDQIIRDFSRSPALFLSKVRGRRYYEDVDTILVYLRVYVLALLYFFQWHARVYIAVYVFSEELCGGVNGVGPFGVSVVRELAQ